MEILEVQGYPVCIARQVLTEEECKLILKASTKKMELKDSTAERWRDRSTYLDRTLERTKLQTSALSILKEYLQVTNQEMVEPPEIVEFNQVTKMSTDEEDNTTSLHVDGQEFGLVFYLNDDYEGGELQYGLHQSGPITDSIAPETGMLVIHPWELWHGPAHVVKGVRYYMTSFVGIQIGVD
jgi:hypothetical protein